jgi:hypothetical protein
MFATRKVWWFQISLALLATTVSQEPAQAMQKICRSNLGLFLARQDSTVLQER